MPWLIKDKAKPAENLLFLHVPRCGGTSLMKCHNVPEKCMKGRSWWGKLGMSFFFHRYKLLESANFPLFTKGNAMAAILFAGATYIRTTTTNRLYFVLSAWITATAVAFFLGLTFVFTAPTIGRVTYVRRLYLVLIHYPLFRFMESIDWCTGTNKKGYINHLTAHKLLHYGYITPEEFESVCSLAIVRNPYTRMVSIYMYNRFGEFESFQHFMRSWYQMMIHYRTTGEMEEWFTPCHGIPQFEYTHFDGKQLVQSIVKQEELKFLKKKEDQHLAVKQDSSVADLPDPVRDALLGMPHANRRVTKKAWWEYYDQETLDLTYKLYQNDFNIFHYSPALEQRPDLTSPETRTLDRSVDAMLRDSTKSSNASMRSTMLRRSSATNSRRTSMISLGPGPLLDISESSAGMTTGERAPLLK